MYELTVEAQFPQQFPREALAATVAALRGDPTVSYHDAGLAAWNVLGYGLSFLPKEQRTPLIGGTPDVLAVRPSDHEIANELEALLMVGATNAPGLDLLKPFLPLLREAAKRLLDQFFDRLAAQ